MINSDVFMDKQQFSVATSGDKISSDGGPGSNLCQFRGTRHEKVWDPLA